MFRKCSSLTSLDISHFNTSSASTLAYTFMFYNASNIENLKLPLFYSSNAQDISYMFYQCKKLKNIDLKFDNLEKIITILSMFV